MKNRIIAGIVLTLGVLAVCRARAQAPAENPYYTAGQFQLNTFGLGRIQSFHRDPAAGVGVSVGHWITQTFGVGMTAEGENTRGTLADRGSVEALFRKPIGASRLAIDASVGAGYDFERDYMMARAFAGPEVAITKHVGAFLHGGYTWSSKVRNEGQVRIGISAKF